MSQMLQKLEDSVISLIDEVEHLRAEMITLTEDNQRLKAEVDEVRGQTSSEQVKLESILSLLDDVDAAKPAAVEVAEPAAEAAVE
jgi:regulator of replication initiation timing